MSTSVNFAESKDIDFAWITNHYNNRHCYPTLAAIAQATTTLKMGPGIMNAFTDTPAAMASFICTLNEISDGRAVLGIGPGDLSTLPKLAINPEKPVARLEEAVVQIRKLCAGEEIKKSGMSFFDYDGAKLTGVTLPGKKGIPVYIGAQGPKVLELAGKVGDGALINASNPKDFQIAIPIIKKASDAAGKKNFDVGAYTAMSIDRSEKKARNAAKIVAAFIAAAHRKHCSPAMVLTSTMSPRSREHSASSTSRPLENLLETKRLMHSPLQVPRKWSSRSAKTSQRPALPRSSSVHHSVPT